MITTFVRDCTKIISGQVCHGSEKLLDEGKGLFLTLYIFFISAFIGSLLNSYVILYIEKTSFIFIFIVPLFIKVYLTIPYIILTYCGDVASDFFTEKH